MTEIKTLMEHIEDELNDACTYVKLALEYKATDPDMAKLFYSLSNEEMNHMNLLHNSVVTHIENYKRTRGEPPTDMTAVYEYVHKRDIEKAEKIAALQAMFKK